LLINGEWRTPVSGQYSNVYNPADGTVVAQVAEGNAADADLAIAAAHAAHVDGRWRNLTPVMRERILLKYADLVEQHADELAQMETIEQGKSILIARHVEVGGSIDFMRYAAGLTTKLVGSSFESSIPTPPGKRATAFTRREPVGVVAAIAPWNFPLSIALWKIMPALAAGNTLVLKPAEITPLTALRLGELALEAGVPPGVFNVITGKGSVAGTAMTSSKLVGKITFTGSTPVGKIIGRAAIENMTRVSLELGGKNPSIVLKDADIDLTVDGLLLGAFFNNGQVCAACSRAYIEAPIYDKIVAALEAAVKGMSVGPGMDPSAQVNPVVSKMQQNSVRDFLSDAMDKKAELIQGADGPNPNGYYVRPTLVINPNADIKLVREEVFGPVLALARVADAEEAIRLANDTDMGLAASLFTQDLSATMNLIPRIEAGTVWVNTHVPLDPAMPFGGYKQSGTGRDFGPRWLESFTEEKSVCIVY
jgi:phenylacetaldehyde dehydrogenase